MARPVHQPHDWHLHHPQWTAAFASVQKEEHFLMSESPGWLLLHAICVARTATFVGPRQKSVEERRGCARGDAGCGEPVVYRPALDYKRTTK